jgi:peptidoglycan/LPS O-acetylase OafA/YrhL
VTITANVETARRATSAHVRQLPGLDGLRALAVIGVIVYHLNPSWLPGGYLGVDVFFVISGYLITALLLAEYSERRDVSLRSFWARRARRLLPALAVLLAITIGLAALFARDALDQLRWDLPAAAAYVLNWRLVFQHQSYVSSFGRPPLLQHLWSLSVEEQFYLLWPPLLLILRRRIRRSRLALFALGGAALSGLLMAVQYRGGDPSAVYFATDTHAEGLLIGAALAAAVPPWRITADIGSGARHLVDRGGLVALAVVVAGMATFGFDSSLTYRGGMVVVDLAAAAVVFSVSHPAGRLGRLLGRPALRWVGLRSYSLYLWHWPIFEMTRPGSDFSVSGWPDVLLRLLLTVVAADATFRLVEQPWRRAEPWQRLKAALLQAGNRSRTILAGTVAAALLATILATAPGPAEPAILSEGSTPAARSLPTAPTDPPDTRSSSAPTGPGGVLGAGTPLLTTPAPASSTATVPRPPSSTRLQTTTTRIPAGTHSASTPTTLPAKGPEPILAIGDSVLLAASPALTSAYGSGITVDAAVGRQVSTGLDRLAAYRSSKALSHYRTVVIDLGTNGQFTAAQFATLAALLQGVPNVVVYTVHAARSWAATDDAVIRAGVAAHAQQMRIADWAHASTGPGLLYPDGIHPDPAGARVYAQLLVTALRA